jgi:hypothetical protein
MGAIGRSLPYAYHTRKPPSGFHQCDPYVDDPPLARGSAAEQGASGAWGEAEAGTQAGAGRPTAASNRHVRHNVERPLRLS